MPQSRQGTASSGSRSRGQSACVVPQEAIVLTRKEHEVLHWGALDKSSWEIAQILECTEATVNFHFANIRRKFKVYSRGAAVHEALRLGLIQL